ncbi:MAG TPA: hypothetical protein VM536_17895, partial [Chloroflexia bacterium]|nr:hypothetical protein [Chloroflexia bacterium]
GPGAADSLARPPRRARGGGPWAGSLLGAPRNIPLYKTSIFGVKVCQRRVGLQADCGGPLGGGGHAAAATSRGLHTAARSTAGWLTAGGSATGPDFGTAL